jgi:hypothetical protein
MRIRSIVGPISIACLTVVGCDSDPGGRLLGVTSAAMSANFSAWSTPVSLGPLVNSASSEQQPTVSKDGLSLYFNSGRLTDASDTQNDLNIWVAHRACADIAEPACAWQQPVALGPNINGPEFDVTPALSRDEHYLFFSSQRPRDNCTSDPCDRDLWVSYRDDVHDDFAWQPAVNLGPGVNGPGEDLAPAFFENEGGQPQLFFTRGLQAASDLYVSVMQPDGTWGAATAIFELNTPNPVAEARPSLTSDGLQLYFWSNRSGSSQIYWSTREGPTAHWSDPILVPSPISDAPSAQPFIYSHGGTESLYFVRTIAGGNVDMFVSQRTRGRF